MHKEDQFFQVVILLSVLDSSSWLSLKEKCSPKYYNDNNQSSVLKSIYTNLSSDFLSFAKKQFRKCFAYQVTSKIASSRHFFL